MLTAEPSGRLRAEWNDTRRCYPSQATVHELIEGQARQNPERVAVRCGDRAISYRELDRAADSLAGWLRAARSGPGGLVGIFLHRSIDMVVAVLGVLKSGAAYVPMDPAFPRERLVEMLEETQLPIVLTQSDLKSSLPTFRGAMLGMEQLERAAPQRSAGEYSGAEDLAYVIFTSGSTGRPKGVQIQHRAVVNFLHSMQREPGLDASDVLLSVTTLSFDIAALELFLPLTTGATVVVAPRKVAADPHLLMAELERTQATVLQATPVTWRMLLEAGWQGNPRLKALIGGEAVPRGLANKLRPLCASLWNMYGPTETTIWSTTGRLEVEEGPVRIGRPIDNTQVYVVSPDMQLQPAGVAGELLIGGAGLAKGYLNRPELTAEKFIPDPFSGVPGARLYRTGDLARWHADGTLECLQRTDQQVKLRGHRIELGEIETALGRHKEVSQSVVVAREDESGEKQLVAYVVLVQRHSLGGSALRTHLRAVLPEYMIPAVFVFLPHLPTTFNGKVDRKRLPAPEQVSEQAHVRPRNHAEEQIASIFSHVLRISKCSVEADFFDLGGNSLLAVILMERMERAFGVRLPLAQLLTDSTVAKLARLTVSEPQPQRAWNSLVPLRLSEGKPALYLVHGAGGNILLYRELADALGEELAVYGFQSRGMDGRAEPWRSVEEMAGFYLEELRAFQPHGPYRLGGYCMGGSVAYEMGRRLVLAGEAVEFVALFDTYNLSSIPRLRGLGRLSRLWQWSGFQLGNVTSLRGRHVRAYLGEKLRRTGEFVANALGNGRRRTTESSQPSARRNGGAIQQLNDEAALNYRPQPQPLRMLLFKPKHNYAHLSDPAMGWREVVGERLELVEICENPHAMLIQPAVQTLAAELRKRWNHG